MKVKTIVIVCECGAETSLTWDEFLSRHWIETEVCGCGCNTVTTKSMADVWCGTCKAAATITF